MSMSNIEYRISDISYSWHATQEHWGFSQGITFSNIILIVLSVIVIISYSNCNNLGARSSTYVLLDAF